MNVKGLRQSCVLAFVFILLSGCMSTVKSISVDNPGNLASKKGYMLFGLDSNASYSSIELYGPEPIKITKSDVKGEKEWVLLEVSSGIYQFRYINFFKMYQQRYPLDGEDWRVTVAPGKVSYVGHLEIRQISKKGNTAHISLTNRSTEAAEHLRSYYPSLFEKYGLYYGGRGEDFFFNDFVAGDVQ